MEKKETPFQQILNEVMAQIKHDIADKEKCDMYIIDLVLNAHNSHYEHEERDSGMVIYDINNQTDVQTCVNKGMGAHTIAELWNGWQEIHCSYFLYGGEKGWIKTMTWEDFIQFLLDNLEDVISAVLRRPFIMDSYRDLYVHYVMPMVVDQLMGQMG